jgi:hypothetical protein
MLVTADRVTWPPRFSQFITILNAIDVKINGNTISINFYAIHNIYFFIVAKVTFSKQPIKSSNILICYWKLDVTF